MYEEKIRISTEIEDKVYEKFSMLPLKSKLVVYAKLMHGPSFRSQNNDMFGLNKKSTSRIFRKFMNTLKEEIGKR